MLKKSMIAIVSGLAVVATAATAVGVGLDGAQPESAPAAPAKEAPKPADTPASAPAQPAEKPAEKAAEPPAHEPAAKAEEVKPFVLGYTVKDIDGKEQDLTQYKGKVVVIINVASECGYTRQYAGLEKLYSEKKDQGLVILGFPANNFGGQEPGTEQTIKQFCTSKYGVTFPMFSKVSVTGDDTHPLFKQLADQPSPVGGAPRWNFTKFVVDREGNAVARFDSKVTPEDTQFRRKIDELLAVNVEETQATPAGEAPAKAAE